MTATREQLAEALQKLVEASPKCERCDRIATHDVAPYEGYFFLCQKHVEDNLLERGLSPDQEFHCRLDCYDALVHALNVLEEYKPNE